MGSECRKACERRRHDPRFTTRWMAGDAIDVGAGNDGLSKSAHYFPLIKSVRDWDTQDGDGQLLEGVPDATFDLVHSSHCLEHLRDPVEALTNWLRVLKPGGFIVCVVPDWDLYEQGAWPSTFNPDHKHAFTTRDKPLDKYLHFLKRVPFDLPVTAEWELVQLLDFTFTPDPRLGRFDYSSAYPTAEPAIEFVLRKPE